MKEKRNRIAADHAIQDGPAISEAHWYSLAVSSAIFTAIAIVSAFAFIFGDGFDHERDLPMAQALAPFGVALFAVVTFCTAGWRGAINTRQANQSESEGRAKLLQEGAKLLAETEKASHVSAGIASLGVLVAGPDEDYAYQAMNLLADFVEDHMRDNHSNRHRPQLSGVMRDGVARGLNTGRTISFDYRADEEDQDAREVYWHFIPGFKRIIYSGGIFENDPEYDINKLDNVELFHVDVANWRNIDIDSKFYMCSFNNCDIHSLINRDGVYINSKDTFSFKMCDFSGCEFYSEDMISGKFKGRENYYIRGNPPFVRGSKKEIDWSAILNCHDSKPDFDWPV